MFDKKENSGNSGYRKEQDSAEGCSLIKRVAFEGSFETARLLPLPQFAFAGRSNVGKSSLINAILNRRIARVSKTPGKTILINFYRVNDIFFLVDLPGYGYAKRPKSMREKWRKIIEDYLKNANLLYHVFVLIDSRHLPMESDIMFIEWLKYYGKEFSVVFTKVDSSTQKTVSSNIKYLKEKVGDFNHFLTSSSKKKGLDKLCRFIFERATL